MDVWMLLAGALVFCAFSAGAWTLLERWWPDAGARRLATTGTAGAALPPRWTDRLPPPVLHWLTWLSRWSLPEASPGPAPADKAAASVASTPLGLRLVRAGWRSQHALWVFGGSKTALLVVLPLLLALIAWPLGLHRGGWVGWAALLAVATLGYMLPDGLLRWQLARRQQALARAFPDALDLLRICVQAGLGLDAAIERVGREMRLASPILSEEWRLTGLELRAGASRAMALRHLADRVGLPDIDALVTMLIQADRFGTRMAEALQVHADALRTQRRLRAEEAAAKLPVKLLIPLVFCIFPALLTVMLGPVGISLYHHFSRQG